MFETLSKKLSSIVAKLGKKGVLTDDIIDTTIREIRVTLIESDVALSVVKQFTANVREKLQNQKIIGGITAEQTIIKIVHDELVDILGGDGSARDLSQGAILMVGLQGSGKTTTTAKLARLIQKKNSSKKVLLVPLDTFRLAAIEQLRSLAKSNEIDFFDGFNDGDNSVEIASKAVQYLKQNKYDYVIYDTAGRLQIDDDLMDELGRIKDIVTPSETILVIDSMIGQDASNIAKSFNEKIGLTGIILTRIDGDGKGGAALSSSYVSGCKILYSCIGEKINDIEPFYPDRIASRILDKGDIMSLIDKAINENVEEELAKVKIGKEFDMNGLMTYLKQIEKLGGMMGILKFIPGMCKLREQIETATGGGALSFKKQMALIQSMTKAERKNPSILNGSRRKRIADGAAQTVHDVNKLMEIYSQIKQMMGMMSGIQNPDGTMDTNKAKGMLDRMFGGH